MARIQKKQPPKPKELTASEARSKARYIRCSPRKARLVIDLIRNKDVNEAESILSGLKQAARIPVLKVIKSAAANAHQQKQLKQEHLYISKITADEGPVLKRYKATAMGRATMIRRKTCHIAVTLGVRKEKAAEIQQKKKPERKAKKKILKK
jgi:large subunit ribosomal protein L22